MTSTSRLLARRYRVDVSTDGLTSWQQIKAVFAVTPDVPQVVGNRVAWVDGWGGAVVLSNGWSLVCSYNQLITGTTRDAGQALVEGCVGQLVNSALLYVRWYDRAGLADAWQGQAAVRVSRVGTGVDDLDRVTVTFTGDGALASIVNPI